MTAFEMGREIGQKLAQGRPITVSREDDTAAARFASEFISGLRSVGAAVEYLAVVSRPLPRSALRSSEAMAHFHVGSNGVARLSVAA
jgi:hypothetical protein